MENQNRIVDVTDMTPAAFDAFLSVACGEPSVVVDHLSPAERKQVVDALGWPDNQAIRRWIGR